MRSIFNIQRSKKIDLKNHFPRAVFWDVDPRSLDLKKDKDFIIERVLSRNMGNPKYLELLEELYSRKDIVKIAVSSNEIRGNVKIRVIANRYNIQPNKIKNFNSSFG